MKMDLPDIDKLKTLFRQNGIGIGDTISVEIQYMGNGLFQYVNNRKDGAAIFLPLDNRPQGEFIPGREYCLYNHQLVKSLILVEPAKRNIRNH